MASISITAPSRAEEGERVSVSVRVTNTLDFHASFKGDISVVPDLSPSYVIGSINQIIKSGESVTRNVSFTLPDSRVTILLWLERWAFDHWTYAGSASKAVSLEIPAPTTFHLSVSVPSGGSISPGSGDYPAYSTLPLLAHALSGFQFTRWGGDASGTSPSYNLYMNSDKNVVATFERVPVPVDGHISRKELEYDETRAPIPVFDIPEGQRGLVHIRGRNDTPESQRMGIYWFVADRDGLIAEEYGPAWEAWPYTGAGKEHEFIGGRFDLDKVGKYTMWVELLMNKDNPEIVDRYIGDLCTVTALEYKGSIARKELEYDETRGAIPVY